MFVWKCVCVLAIIWLWPDTGPICPEPTHWQASFALNSVSSTWLGDNSVVLAQDGPCEGPHFFTLGASQPPTLVLFGPLISASPGPLRSRHHPQGARGAPHHCRQYVTFSAKRGDEGEGQKKKEEKKNRQKKYGLVLLKNKVTTGIL